MGWKDKMTEFGGANLAFLSEDGEVMTFVVIAEPVLIEGKYRGKQTQRIGAPVITQEGFTLFILGKRLARRISKHEAEFNKVAFEVVRHGVEGDTDTRYELKISDDKDLTKELLAIAAKGVDKAEIADAVKEAVTIANQ